MVQSAGRISLWGIEAFLAAAEEGTVSAAARRLQASPSAISQQISALEAALGATLMDRATRPVMLTPAGEMFRQRARVILTEAHQARAELAAEDMAGLTRFRLGMIEDFEADVTPRLLAGMAEDLRQCQFQLVTGPSHRLFDLLDTRALDMVVAADMGATADWMEVHPLLSEPFVAAVPRGAVDPGGDVLAQLKTLPLIQYTLRHLMGRQIAEHLARQNLTLAHRFELDSYPAIMAMVAGGAGWTILTPLGYLHAQRFGDEVALMPLPFEPLSRTISLSARRGVLRDMPERVADRLRGLVRAVVVDPSLARLPWLEGRLKVHERP
ncbi:DNA-binding transcriptional LysR family regulator [Rhodovulum iodosum]|uniref:DNA-binding transcriptional LysR family regulator n=1 Tax=Rhodovulum iodosum TaxID=68291 RepID=A0ABV3XNH9_9RHOB|nr:LysR family transcriptional regulator [Rhodovulum robiginosum]RSK34759.1 LysR family transcriptional regulator [Rhodovulum robiginosum]